MGAERLVGLTDLKKTLSAILKALPERPVVLLRHNTPVAALLDYDQYVGLLELVEDLEDRLAVTDAAQESSDLKRPWAKARIGASVIDRIRSKNEADEDEALDDASLGIHEIRSQED